MTPPRQSPNERMERPRLLDLFCGAGGAAMGYHRAGFEVVGVDIEPQPNYPFEFVQADAVRWASLRMAEAKHWGLGERWGLCLWDFDAIHASPPCQGYTSAGRRYADTQAAHPRLIAEIRRLLQATGPVNLDRFRKAAGLPYVIENVPGARAHLDHPVQLCSRGFGLGVGRHRLYECSFPVMSVQCQCDGTELPVYGKLDGRRLWTRKDGSELRAARTLEEAREAMGIDWMDWDELREAIPPAHTEHVGRYLMAEVRERQKEAA